MNHVHRTTFSSGTHAGTRVRRFRAGPAVLAVVATLALQPLAAAQPAQSAPGSHAAAPSVHAQPAPITTASLLRDLQDPAAPLATFARPFTTRQTSSYDRASLAPDRPGWFANADAGNFLRIDTLALPDGSTRTEHVMLDTPGPGAVVRIWSPNPKGTLRVYLDHQPDPVIAAPMADLLAGKLSLGNTTVSEPLAGMRSLGWNLFLPIPYAQHCRITTDQPGSYYHVNYRTYVPGTPVEPFTSASLGALPTSRALTAHRVPPPATPAPLAPGQSREHPAPAGPHTINALRLDLPTTDLPRSLVLEIEFDGQRTVSVPVTDFFGAVNPAAKLAADRSHFADSRRVVTADSVASFWPMPYLHSALIRVKNLGSAPVPVAISISTTTSEPPTPADPLYFHAGWKREYPIHTKKADGTKDYNYVTLSGGRGVFVGDNLSVLNPVKAWWGEGDEKIYVDHEPFPSHFGTGTEDYYGYGWCNNGPFQHPFHSQIRCDGYPTSDNWGRSFVTRLRGLDTIPFTTSFRFDMEVWHWVAVDVEYATTVYYYATRDTTSSLPACDDAARAPVPSAPPLPPPFAIAGAIECETLTVSKTSPNLDLGPQAMSGFAERTWSGEAHLWVRAKQPGDYIELPLAASLTSPTPNSSAKTLVLHATRAPDYGIVRFTLRDSAGAAIATSDPIDFYHPTVAATGPLTLFTIPASHLGKSLVLHAEVTGANPQSHGSRFMFGLDCLVISPP